MPDYKVNGFFTFPGRADAAAAGWSETWYTTASDLGQANLAMQPFYEARRGLLADPCTYAANRVAELGSNRISQLFPMRGGANFPVLSGQSDNAWQCALISCRTGLSFHRTWFLRGVPDGLFDIADPSNPAYSAWLGRWNALAAEIATDTYPIYMRVLDRVSNPKLSIKTLTYLKVTRQLVLEVDGNPGWAVGDLIKFYKITGYYPSLGIRPIANFVFAGGVSTFRFDYDGAEGDSPAVGARVMRSAFGLFRIREVNWLRTGHRDTGRPFNLQRGRAPRRA